MKRDLILGPSRISISVPMTVSSLIFSATACISLVETVSLFVVLEGILSAVETRARRDDVSSVVKRGMLSVIQTVPF